LSSIEQLISIVNRVVNKMLLITRLIAVPKFLNAVIFSEDSYWHLTTLSRGYVPQTGTCDIR